jgi:hypothetical protein
MTIEGAGAIAFGPFFYVLQRRVKMEEMRRAAISAALDEVEATRVPDRLYHQRVWMTTEEFLAAEADVLTKRAAVLTPIMNRLCSELGMGELNLETPEGAALFRDFHIIRQEREAKE